MKKIILFSTLVALTALTISCASPVGVQPVDSVERPPNTGSISVYESADEVKRPYKTIAFLEVTNQKRVREEKGDFTDSLLDQARELGADGVIILENRQKTQRNSDGMGGYFTFQVLYTKAEAIVYE